MNWVCVLKEVAVPQQHPLSLLPGMPDNFLLCSALMWGGVASIVYIAIHSIPFVVMSLLPVYDRMAITIKPG